MVSHLTFGSSSFKMVAKGLVALHRLGKAGKDDSPEADAIRDALDSPLKALSETEKERAQWLSEDLYSVSEPPPAITQKEMNSQAQQQLIEAVEARKSQEWDRALAILRRWQLHISPAVLSYMRGTVWEEAGYSNVAAFFYGHAAETDPATAKYRALYLSALAEVDPNAAGKLATQVLDDPERFAPIVVVEAANIRFSETGHASENESSRVYRELIAILEKNLTRIEDEEGATSRSPEYEMTVGKLGICHELLGNSSAAVDYFSRGLHANPDNDGLLAARGTLQYGSSPRAVADFERAVRLGIDMIWPYLFLAHHYLTTSRFEQCRAMCERGLTMRGSDSAKSQLEEWRAIAQAELGFPPESVRAAFEAAVCLDPSNDLARRNRAAFEASLGMAHTPHRARWEHKSDAAVRQFGLAERRYSLAA